MATADDGEPAPMDNERAKDIADSMVALEVSIEVATSHLKSIAESLSSIRDTHTRIAEQLAIFVASSHAEK